MHSSEIKTILVKYILIPFFIFQIKLMAQTGIQGEYAFRRQEMVAAFNFTSDGRFEFFYSYGAADRSATGSFTVDGDTLKLKSDKEAGKDFAIKKQTRSGSGFTITSHAPNPSTSLKLLSTKARSSVWLIPLRHRWFLSRWSLINCFSVS